jgi:hypothetical protein
MIHKLVGINGEKRNSGFLNSGCNSRHENALNLNVSLFFRSTHELLSGVHGFFASHGKKYPGHDQDFWTGLKPMEALRPQPDSTRTNRTSVRRNKE